MTSLLEHSKPNVDICQMVFWYQNCSDLNLRKNCSCDRKKLLKFEAEGQEFAIFLRSLEQFIPTVKNQNNFCIRILSPPVSRGFYKCNASEPIEKNNLNLET